MNFRHLKFFVATAESGQVSRAATQLSISQSAVTSAIKELEADLGTQLFVRSSQGMEMTEAGYLNRRHIHCYWLFSAGASRSVKTTLPKS